MIYPVNPLIYGKQIAVYGKTGDDYTDGCARVNFETMRKGIVVLDDEGTFQVFDVFAR